MKARSPFIVGCEQLQHCCIIVRLQLVHRALTHFEARQAHAARCWTLHLSLNTKVAPVALVQASRGQNVVQQHLLRLRQVIHVVAM